MSSASTPPSRADAQGIGFAIPINIAKPIMQQAIEGKPLTRPWIGITFVPINAAWHRSGACPSTTASWSRRSADGSLPGVIPDSPAAAAGLQEGDIITAIDDQRIDAQHPLDDILTQYQPEGHDPIVISILRDGTPGEKVLYLATRDASSTS